MLDAKPDVGILVKGAFTSRAYIGRLERNRLIAVSLRHLHAAIPHPVPHVAAPEENQARFQFLFLGKKRHVASCCLFRSVQFPCRLSAQVIDSSWLCRLCIEHHNIICCLFIIIYDIVLILSGVWRFLRQTESKDPRLLFAMALLTRLSPDRGPGTRTLCAAVEKKGKGW